MTDEKNTESNQLPKQPEQNLGGTKLDSNKCQLELLSSAWIFGVGDVLTFGAKKYAAHNWRKGIVLSRLIGACLRHIFAFLRGEDKDPETNLSHLLHASCCLMFAYELHLTKASEVDDRFKLTQKDSSDQRYSYADQMKERALFRSEVSDEDLLREIARQKEMLRG